MAFPILKRNHSSNCADALAPESPRKREKLASSSDSLLSSPPTSLPDLPNELLLEIFAALPNTVEVILALATTCRRLNEFAMVYYFGSVHSYEFCSRSSNQPIGKKCGKHVRRRPYTSFRIFRLSFIYKPPLAVIYCKFSKKYQQEMREIKRSLTALKRMDLLSGKISISFELIDWPKIPTETHAAFFEDLSKLGCQTIEWCPTAKFSDAPSASTSVNLVFDPPVLTKLTKVTLSTCPEQYTAWTLRCIEESPIETLDLRAISDDVLLKLNTFSLPNLQNMTLTRCAFSFVAFSSFLEHHSHLKTLDLGTWSPILRIAGRRSLRLMGDSKSSLQPATRMSLTCIDGTAMTVRTLLSTAEVFPVLQSVTITGTGRNTLETQEALLLIAHIPTVDHLSISQNHFSSTDWIQFKFPRWRGLDVRRAEALLTGITDFSIRLHPPDGPEVLAAVASIPNLKRFRTWLPNRSNTEILGFVGRMKDACPSLENVVVNGSEFSTDPRWLRQKELELKGKKGR